MIKAIIIKILSMIATMIIISILIFALLEYNAIQIAKNNLGQFSTLDQQKIWLSANGFDASIIGRYYQWFGNFIAGDFGESVRFKVPVSTLIAPRLFNSLILCGFVLLLMIPISWILGIIAGVNHGSWLDKAISFMAICATSLPEYIIAIFLSSIFVFWLGWLPGTSSMYAGFNFKELILPALILTFFSFGYITRIMRNSVVRVMQSNYIKTAILKGLPMKIVIFKHVLKNALIVPVIASLMQINWLISGVVIIEYFTAYKGFGALILEASLNQDLYLLQATSIIAVGFAVFTQSLTEVFQYYAAKIGGNYD